MVSFIEFVENVVEITSSSCYTTSPASRQRSNLMGTVGQTDFIRKIIIINFNPHSATYVDFKQELWTSWWPRLVSKTAELLGGEFKRKIRVKDSAPIM